LLKTGATSQSLNVEKIRSDFPILKRRVHEKRLVYLDNAATTQKPKQVIDALKEYYENYNSNIHRSVHLLAEEATEAFEGTRDKVQRFINAASRDEIVFTRNATEALNIAARSTTNSINPGDKIVVTEMEHHSNFVPWQQIAKKKKARLEIVSVTDEGEIDEGDMEAKVSGAKIFAFSHMSNVLGTINDAKKLTRMAHEQGAIVVLDGAQSSPHIPVDMIGLDCDYFALSAHKMLGPTGVGCLFGKRDLLENDPPFLLGGDMIKEVHRDETKWNDIPWKFEAGTSNIADVIAFAPALDYLGKIGMKNLQNHEKEICKTALEELPKIEGLEIYGPKDPERRGAVFAFNLAKIHAHDIASILDAEGIAIRSGHHCAQVLMEKLNVPATSRASFYLYNDYDDLEALIKGIRKVGEVLNL
jgi:cysteine desulfurase / selenocysteine lyase